MIIKSGNANMKNVKIELVTQTQIVSFIMPKLFSNVMVKNLQDPGLNNMSL